MALNVKPLGDRILVEAVEEKEQKKGGIIIPDTAKEKPMESIVVALGTGKTNDDGKKVPFEVKKGDRILVSESTSHRCLLLLVLVHDFELRIDDVAAVALTCAFFRAALWLRFRPGLRTSLR